MERKPWACKMNHRAGFAVYANLSLSKSVKDLAFARFPPQTNMDCSWLTKQVSDRVHTPDLSPSPLASQQALLSLAAIMHLLILSEHINGLIKVSVCHRRIHPEPATLHVKP